MKENKSYKESERRERGGGKRESIRGKRTKDGKGTTELSLTVKSLLQ